MKKFNVGDNVIYEYRSGLTSKAVVKKKLIAYIIQLENGRTQLVYPNSLTESKIKKL